MEEATDYSNNARDLFADATQFPNGSPDRIKKLKSAADAFRNELALHHDESFQSSYRFIYCLYLIDVEYRLNKSADEIAHYERNYGHYIDLNKDYPLVYYHILQRIKIKFEDDNVRKKEIRKLESKHIETVYKLCKSMVS